MAAKKWSDIRALKFSPAELREIDEEICAVLNGKRIKLAEG